MMTVQTQRSPMKNSFKRNDDKWLEFKQRIQVLKDAVDGRLLLESLGFTITKETTKELRAACRIHGGDNTTAFRFNKERHTWVCFSHKCHDIFGNDVISLIKACEGTDFKGAVRYLRELTGDIDTDPRKFIELQRQQERRAFIREHCTTHRIPHYVSENNLQKHLHLRSNAFIIDGFKSETLDHFEVGGGYVDEEGDIRDIIPIRDIDGTLLAYSQRDIRRNIDIPDDDKYKITPGLLKDRILYNLNNAKEYLPEHKLIIVEGFKSVWWLYEMGIYNVVAVMGSSITPGQQTLLYQYAHSGIVILFDNDVPGLEGAQKAYEQMFNKINIIPIIMYGPEGTDPADIDKDVLYKFLKDYV